MDRHFKDELAGLMVALLCLAPAKGADTSSGACRKLVAGTQISKCIAATDVVKQIESGQTNFDKTAVLGLLDFGRIRPRNWHLISGVGVLTRTAPFFLLSFQGTIFERNPIFGRLRAAINLDFRGAVVGGPGGPKVAVPGGVVADAVWRQANLLLWGGRVTGPFNIGKPPFWPPEPGRSEPIRGDIDMNDCDIEGPINAHAAVFEGNVRFWHCDFWSEVDLTGTTFAEEVMLDGTFRSSTLPIAATFKKGGFVGGTFQKPLVLSRARSEGDLIIRGVFKGKSSVDKAALQFEECEFERLAVEGTFDGTISIDNDTRVRGGLDLQGIRAEGVDISNSEFGSIVVWSFRTPVRFSLNGVSASSLLLHNLGPSGPVMLRGLSLNGAWLDWNTLGSRLEGDSQSLINLEAACRHLGYSWLANQVYYKRKRQERSQMPFYARAWEYVFFDLPCGYGTRPFRTVPYAAALIVIFGVLFSFRASLDAKEGGSHSFSALPFAARLAEGTIYSVSCFFKISVSDWSASRWRCRALSVRIGRRRRQLLLLPGIQIFRWLAVIEAILGWFLLALFIATYARVALT
jgi:hypothetical protein